MSKEDAETNSNEVIVSTVMAETENATVESNLEENAMSTKLIDDVKNTKIVFCDG